MLVYASGRSHLSSSANQGKSIPAGQFTQTSQLFTPFHQGIYTYEELV